MPIKACNASTRPLMCLRNIHASCTHAYNSRMCATRDGVLILLRMHGLVSPEFPLSTATKLRNPTHADDHLHTHEQHTSTPPEDHSKTQSVTKEQSAERRGGRREYACCKLHHTAHLQLWPSSIPTSLLSRLSPDSPAASEHRRQPRRQPSSPSSLQPCRPPPPCAPPSQQLLQPCHPPPPNSEAAGQLQLACRRVRPSSCSCAPWSATKTERETGWYIYYVGSQLPPSCLHS